MSLFIENKYHRWYFNIILRAKSRSDFTGYSERHHIIPKSLGGSNEPENLVRLTAREHFICHWLLIKMVIDDRHKTSMRYALVRMSHINDHTGGRRVITSRNFEIIRKHAALAASETHKGRIFSEETRKKLRESRIGKTVSAETRQKMIGRKYSEESRKKMSESQKRLPTRPELLAQLRKMADARIGIKLSEATKVKIREARAKQVYSDEARRKMSESHMGNPSPRKGKKMTEEAREIMKQKMKETIARKKQLNR